MLCLITIIKDVPYKMNTLNDCNRQKPDVTKKNAVILTAMCSLDWTGWNPTNDICIDNIVPRQ